MSRVACTLIAAVLLVAANAHATAPRVAQPISQAMQDRDFTAAVQAIDKSLQAGEGPADYLNYLKGRALHYLEKYADAVKAFESLEKAYPDSPWAAPSRVLPKRRRWPGWATFSRPS